MESKCHNFLGKINYFPNTYIMHLYIYVYKSFPTTLDKRVRKNIKKEMKLENINEMGALNMK